MSILGEETLESQSPAVASTGPNSQNIMMPGKNINITKTIHTMNIKARKHMYANKLHKFVDKMKICECLSEGLEMDLQNTGIDLPHTMLLIRVFQAASFLC